MVIGDLRMASEHKKEIEKIEEKTEKDEIKETEQETNKELEEKKLPEIKEPKKDDNNKKSSTRKPRSDKGKPHKKPAGSTSEYEIIGEKTTDTRTPHTKNINEDSGDDNTKKNKDNTMLYVVLFGVGMLAVLYFIVPMFVNDDSDNESPGSNADWRPTAK